MPRYVYRCEHCEEVLVVMHGVEEPYKTCGACGYEDTLVKQLSYPSISTSKRETVGRVGEITEEFIKSARTDLKQQIKDMKEDS